MDLLAEPLPCRHGQPLCPGDLKPVTRGRRAPLRPRPDRVAPHASGDLEPTNGEARRSHTLRVGRYAQHFVDALQMDENPVEYLLRKYPQARAGARPAACQRAACAKHLYLLCCNALTAG